MMQFTLNSPSGDGPSWSLHAVDDTWYNSSGNDNCGCFGSQSQRLGLSCWSRSPFARLSGGKQGVLTMRPLVDITL